MDGSEAQRTGYRKQDNAEKLIIRNRDSDIEMTADKILNLIKTRDNQNYSDNNRDGSP